MSERVFVDTAWNRKPHACYDPDADKFFELIIVCGYRRKKHAFSLMEVIFKHSFL